MDFCEYIYIYLDGNGGRIDSRQRILFSLSRTIPTNEQKNRTDLIQKWPSVCFPLVVDLLFSSLFLSFFWFLFFFFCSISLLSRSRSTEIHLFTVFLCGWFIDYSQPCKYSFGTNRNAPGQPEDPIFLAMPVISAPSSRVHLVKTERQRERVTRSTFRSKTGIAVSLLPLLWNSRAILLSLLLRTNGKIDSSPRKFEFLCDPGKVLEGGLREWGRWREKFAGRMDIDGIGHRKNVTVIGAILLEIRLLPLRCIFVWQMDQFFFPSWKTCPNTLSIVYELCVHFYFISKLSINYFHSFFQKFISKFVRYNKQPLFFNNNFLQLLYDSTKHFSWNRFFINPQPIRFLLHHKPNRHGIQRGCFQRLVSKNGVLQYLNKYIFNYIFKNIIRCKISILSFLYKIYISIKIITIYIYRNQSFFAL